MKSISSRDNPTYKLAVKLAKRKFRDETGLYLLEGKKPLQDALSEGIRVEQIYVAAGTEPQTFEGQRVVSLDKKLFAEIADTKTSQGIIAIVQQQPSTEERLEEILNGPGRLLVLDRIQDPGNLGTMIRTAEAAGMAGVLLMTGCADCYAPKVVRSAAGSLFRVPVITRIKEEHLLEKVPSSGRSLLVTALEGAEDYRKIHYPERSMIVIGNEGSGVSPGFLGAADLKIRIPMAGAIESLNAAVAAGILMYESQTS